MIKKKLLALGVSAVAVTAVVGAGFAGWTFTSEAKKEHSIGINVTAAYSFGTIDVETTAPDTLVLDQSGITLADSDALTDKIDGVTAKWTVNTSSYTDAVAAGITYAVNVYVADGLADYVNCGTTTAETSSLKTGYTQYTITVSPEESDITTEGANTVVALTVKNPFGYTAKKPTTFEDYQKMVAAIKGVEASTVTKDTVYDVAATDASVIIEFTVTKTTD